MIPFDISLDPPKFGWLPINIKIDGVCHTFEASDVLNDPVSELVDACLVLLDGKGSAMIGFWLEPLWHMLELQDDGQGLTTVTFYYAANENQQNPEFKSTIAVDTVSLCRHVLTRLRTLHEATGATRYPTDECWGMAFPDSRISAALERIRTESRG